MAVPDMAASRRRESLAMNMWQLPEHAALPPGSCCANCGATPDADGSAAAAGVVIVLRGRHVAAVWVMLP